MAGPLSLPLRLVPRPLGSANRLPATVANTVLNQNNLAQFLDTHLKDIQKAVTQQNGQASGGIVLAADQPARTNGYEATSMIAPFIGDLESQPSAVSYDGPLNFNAGDLPMGVNSTYGYARWAGWLIAPEAGSYAFQVVATDGANLFVNRTLLIGKLTSPGAINQTANINLVEGAVPIVAEWQWGTDAPSFALNWTPPGAASVLIPNTALSRSLALPVSGFLVGWWWSSNANSWYPGQAVGQPSIQGFVDNEPLAGVLNGVNAVFTISQMPVTNSQHVYRNIRQVPGIGYTISGTTITFAAGNIPVPGDTLVADYRVL